MAAAELLYALGDQLTEGAELLKSGGCQRRSSMTSCGTRCVPRRTALAGQWRYALAP